MEVSKSILLLAVMINAYFLLGLDLVDSMKCKSASQTTLRLLSLLPSGHELLSRSETPWGVAKVLDAAVDSINNSSDLLPCHNLELVHQPGGCDKTENTLTSLVSGLFPQDGSKVVGILGPACSDSARKVVYVAGKPEIELVVLHNGGSSMLGNLNHSISILGSNSLLLDLSYAVIEKSGWKSICVLYESDSFYYHGLKEDFLSKLHASVTVSLIAQISASFYPLNEIRSSSVRIVFLFASLEQSQRLLCWAYHEDLVYPAYQWVIMGHNLSDFVGKHSYGYTFDYNTSEFVCSNTNLVQALERSFFTSLQLFPNSDSFHLANHFERKHDNASVTPTYAVLNYILLDSLWAWTIVLQNLTTNCHEVVFNYGNATLVDVIRNQFFSLSVEGASGTVSFNSTTGFANRLANLYQLNQGRQMLIGSNNSTFLSVSKSFSYISDHVKLVNLPDEGIVGFFVAVQCILLVIVGCLHVMMLVHRKTKTVKATSPKLTNFVFLGAYVFILTLMINSISWLIDYGPQTDAALCQVVWAWGLPISFTLTMGTVTVRTWRLYRIFVHYLDPGKLISNPALTVAVSMMVSVDIVIAVVWTVADPMRFMYTEITVRRGSVSEVLLEPECHFNFAWFVLIFLYKFTLLIALIVLTVLTRRIQNSTFSTKSLQLFTYTFSSVLLLGFTLYYMFVFIRHDPYSEFITLSTVLNLLLGVVVSFVIVPPLFPVFHQKIKKNIQSSSKVKVTPRSTKM